MVIQSLAVNAAQIVSGLSGKNMFLMGLAEQVRSRLFHVRKCPVICDAECSTAVVEKCGFIPLDAV